MIREPYQYEDTYIGLPVDVSTFATFPESVGWKGDSLLKKDNFHVTICKGGTVFAMAYLDQSVAEEKLLAMFNTFVERHPIKLVSFFDDFRSVEDSVRGRKTIVVRCRLSNFDEFFAELNHAFEIDMPLQPAHVTLYTLQKNLGIHIPSGEIMESLPKVSIPALDEAFKRTRLRD